MQGKGLIRERKIVNLYMIEMKRKNNRTLHAKNENLLYVKSLKFISLKQDLKCI